MEKRKDNVKIIRHIKVSSNLDRNIPLLTQILLAEALTILFRETN